MKRLSSFWAFALTLLASGAVGIAFGYVFLMPHS